jgi:hypothetical protein
VPARSLALLVVAAAVALVASSSHWVGFLGDPTAWPQSDFQILWAAGHGLAEGRDVTDPAVLDELGARAGREATPFSASQPLVARLFGATSDDFPRAYRTWLWLHGLLGAGAVLLLVRLLRGEGLGALAAAALALAAVGLHDGLFMSLAMNSTNLVTLAAVCAAALAARSGKPVAEGLALAVAVIAKTSPVLLVFVAALAGRLRVAFVAAGAWLLASLGSVAWIGTAPHLAWWERTAPALGYAPERAAGEFSNALHAWNLSPHGLLARTAYRADWPRPLVLAAALTVAALVLWQLALAARSQRTAADAPTLTATALAGTLLVSSVTWPHHLVLAALPVALLAARWRQSPAVASVGLLAGALLMTPLGLLDDDPSLGLEGPLRTGALVVMFGALVALPTRGGQPDEPPVTAEGTP